jgi:hypothetical protein
MRQRPPYSMTQFAVEVVATDKAKVKYLNPDGLGVYLDMQIVSENSERWMKTLKHVARADRRIAKVSRKDGKVTVTFTAAGGRWTRDPFHLAEMWEALDQP